MIRSLGGALALLLVAIVARSEAEPPDYQSNMLRAASHARKTQARVHQARPASYAEPNPIAPRGREELGPWANYAQPPEQALFSEQSDEMSDDEPESMPAPDEAIAGFGDDYCTACDMEPMPVCCKPCGLWIQADLLYWWIRGSTAPPLLTTSPAGTLAVDAGVLPAAQILYPQGKLNTNGQLGGRYTLGYWLDDCQTLGIQGNYFFVGNQLNTFNAASGADGQPILARPFFDTSTSAESALLVAYPNIASGSAAITTSARLQGAEANIREALYVHKCSRLDVFWGYRFLRFDDSVGVSTNSVALAQNPLPVGTTLQFHDYFGSTNIFNGGQVALKYQNCYGGWGFDVLGKFAVGALSERVDIHGSTVLTQPSSAPQTAGQGLLALPSNSGIHRRSYFSVIPELDSNIYWQLTNRWRCNVGYTLFCVTHVTQAASTINRNIDPAQTTGSAGTNPTFGFNTTALWVQGVNVGIEYRF